jgi:hypothetical protein
VGRGVLGAHDLGRRLLDGLLQRDPLEALEGHVAEALVGWSHPVVRLRRGPQPALAHLAALAEVVAVLGQAEPSSGGQEVSADPGRLETQDAVTVGDGPIDEIASHIDRHC